MLVRRFRLGVTELTALTWLPALVEALRQTYPKVQIEPSVELSSELYHKLESDQLDLIVVPDVYSDARFVATPLKTVENAWMCAPGLVPEADPVSLERLAGHTVLTQGSQSGTGLIYERWLASHKVQMPRTLTSHNLLVQVGLTLSGMGVSYLPKDCLSHLIEQGALRGHRIGVGLFIDVDADGRGVVRGVFAGADAADAEAGLTVSATTFVSNGAGTEAEAEITATSRGSVTLSARIVVTTPRPSAAITLGHVIVGTHAPARALGAAVFAGLPAGGRPAGGAYSGCSQTYSRRLAPR